MPRLSPGFEPLPSFLRPSTTDLSSKIINILSLLLQFLDHNIWMVAYFFLSFFLWYFLLLLSSERCKSCLVFGFIAAAAATQIKRKGDNKRKKRLKRFSCLQLLEHEDLIFCRVIVLRMGCYVSKEAKLLRKPNF